jgi:preprotein translocase subunit SecE
LTDDQWWASIVLDSLRQADLFNWEKPVIVAKSANKKSDTNITRISASDSGEKRVKKPSTKTSAAKVKPAIDSKKKPVKVAAEQSAVSRGPLGAIGRYFKGAWFELRQVRWPDRKSTWGMTGALLLFTAFFIVVILLLDAGFAYLFKLIMGTN